jgi:hypothetical protein
MFTLRIQTREEIIMILSLSTPFTILASNLASARRRI